jgi:RNA polymerase sigma-70 factor (ECF subfamily)
MTAYGEKSMTEHDFKCLFDNYKKRVFGYVLTLSHSAFTAEELTQEIFIKLWLCRNRLGGVDNIEGYIFTVARNKTLNYLRKAAHESKALRELCSRMIPENNNVEERAIIYDRHKQLREALTRLSPQRLLVYQLSRDQGLNHKEIARQLHVSPHTVKNQLVMALKFIRKHLVLLNGLMLCLPGPS